MKISLKIALGVLYFTAIFLVACTKKATEPIPATVSAPVTITSLSVYSGPFDAIVDINGTGFNATAAQDQVFFNGKTASVIAASTNQLTVKVPQGAGTGKITVSVSNATPIVGPLFNYEYTVTVSTFAGSGAASSLDGTGTSASFNSPADIKIDSLDNLYVADEGGGKIRKITMDGKVTTIAGNGQQATIDGTATSSAFHFPYSMAIDAKDNIYVVEASVGGYIRKISSSGQVSTIAGDGHNGYKDGPGASAEFFNPLGIVLDPAGNLFVGDVSNGAIRKITPDGTVSTFLKTPDIGQPGAIAFDAAGNLFSIDQINGSIDKIAPNGMVTTLVGGTNTGLLNIPWGMAIDSFGNLYIADFGSVTILKVTPNGILSQIAGVIGRSGAINGAGMSATFIGPSGIAVSRKSGIIFVADQGNNLIRKIIMQ